MLFDDMGGDGYIWFQLEPKDYKRYGEAACTKLIETMKAQIPAAERHWIAAHKVWRIHPRWAKRLQLLVSDKLVQSQMKLL